MTALNTGDVSQKTYYIHPAAFGGTKDPGHGHVPVVKADDFEKLRAKLEAAEKRIAELQIARDKCFLSGLKTGWEYGIADYTEGYNREIADAQAVIDRAAGIGVKGE
ncbi:hypothetical protein [Citrobacter sp. wls718]|uniref:hypothetical protein n=1 Tax=Citrobacter sp. wls718 TaxID=2576418 RepID=UPI000DFE9F03|nr:hypothetical protein [Citrobacter sp. wls718]TKU32994.1 hypothetical protein FDW95_07480 [Citrobacter sp. wls718]STE16140.1 Uncharacterised protein [Escherichia coli]